MGWIKRNLIFVVSGCLALGLLGFAGFLIYQGYTRNSEAADTLNGIYDSLIQLNQMPQQPGNEKINNIGTAKDQELQLAEWITNSMGYFGAIPRIPEGEVTSMTYANALGKTIYQLQQEAKADSVELPPQYYFSFQVQSSKLTISSGLVPLAQQLGEVKTIAEILFAARVNDLDSIQRVRVSDDDVSGGLQSDYIDAHPITNNLAVITPYMVTFRGFTPELAKVITGFATASNTLIVKAISVQPASTGTTPDNTMAPGPAENPYNHYNPYNPYNRGMPQEQAVAPVANKGGLPTVLKEQLLRFTLEVDIVKLLPKS